VLGSGGFGYVRDQARGRDEAFPQVGRPGVEDDVEIGALCAIDRGPLGASAPPAAEGAGGAGETGSVRLLADRRLQPTAASAMVERPRLNRGRHGNVHQVG
jgi:hypothetical protein